MEGDIEFLGGLFEDVGSAGAGGGDGVAQVWLVVEHGHGGGHVGRSHADDAEADSCVAHRGCLLSARGVWADCRVAAWGPVAVVCMGTCGRVVAQGLCRVKGTGAYGTPVWRSLHIGRGWGY